MRISDLLGEPDKRKPDTEDQATSEASPAPPTDTGAAAATAAAAEAAASIPDPPSPPDVARTPDADRLSFGSALGSPEQRARGVQASPVAEGSDDADAPTGMGAPDDDLLPDRNRKR